MKEAIAAILKQEGYVDDVTVEDRNINIQLKYFKGKPAIEGLKRMSKPGRRVYVCPRNPPRAERPRHLHPVHFARVPAGDKAHQMKVGGELLCEIW